MNPKLQLDEYFRKMDQIVKKREVSLRVIFMLQDVMDLRMVGGSARSGLRADLASMFCILRVCKVLSPKSVAK